MAAGIPLSKDNSIGCSTGMSLVFNIVPNTTQRNLRVLLSSGCIPFELFWLLLVSLFKLSYWLVIQAGELSTSRGPYRLDVELPLFALFWFTK